MREFMSYVLQSFREATGWNGDHSYSELNRTAEELLNFHTPRGLRLTLSSLATPHFAASYVLGSVGVVDGSLSYLYSSVPLKNIIARSEVIPLPTLLRGYRQLRDLPRVSATDDVLGPTTTTVPALAPGARPRSGLMQGAQKLLENPTLLYGRLYLPRSMLEAFVVKRITPSVQLQLRAVSESQLPNGGTVLGMIQYDKGRYGLEGIASTDGGLLGIRGLYNLDSTPATPAAAPGSGVGGSGSAEEAAGGHGSAGEKERIYGRFSAGGEIYYGTLNKSGGISLGARFATLPAHRGTPLTATLTVNPLMGNISATYSLVAREYCSLATKFDFNVYSYESDWTVGVELWSRRRLAGLVETEELSEPRKPDVPRPKERSFQAKLEWRLDEPELPQATVEEKKQKQKKQPFVEASAGGERRVDEDYQGVLKARLGQNLRVGLLWEGRMKSLLFSLGSAVDLRKLDQPFQTLGLEIQFSS